MNNEFYNKLLSHYNYVVSQLSLSLSPLYSFFNKSHDLLLENSFQIFNPKSGFEGHNKLVSELSTLQPVAMVEGTRQYQYVEGRLAEMDVRNQTMDVRNQAMEGQIEMVEVKLQKLDNGMDVIRSEMADHKVQITRVLEIVTNKSNREDLEDNMKGILGSAPIGSSNASSSQRQPSQSLPEIAAVPAELRRSLPELETCSTVFWPFPGDDENRNNGLLPSATEKLPNPPGVPRVLGKEDGQSYCYHMHHSSTDRLK